MLSRLSAGTKKYMLIEIEELIWVNVSARRTQSLRSCPMPELGQSRRFGRWPMTCGLPPETDIHSAGRHVSNVPTGDSCAAANSRSIQSPHRRERVALAVRQAPAHQQS